MSSPLRCCQDSDGSEDLANQNTHNAVLDAVSNYHFGELVFLHGRMTWWVMQRSVWNDIVSWQTRLHNNSTKYLLHASMTTTSKKKKQNLLENCQIHALKLF